MKKQHILVVISLLAAYFAMLALLVYAESFSDAASITSMKDALWYSVVTLTTVGYGDLSPVTALGKVIGSVFLLLSTSLLAMLVVLVMTFGQVWVRFRLGFLQSAQWFVFSSLNEATCALAQSIEAENPQAVLLFPKDDNKDLTAIMKKSAAMFVKGGVEDILALKKTTTGLNLFFMDPDGYSNYNNAVSFCGKGYSVYCQSDFTAGAQPADLTVFSMAENTARLYWRTKPLPATAKNVVIIADGDYTDALLAQALQVNLYHPQQSVCYHIFAPDTDFIAMHPQLATMVSVNEISAERDSLFFYNTAWENHIDVITQADRVIVSTTADRENLRIYNSLMKYFVLKGDIHLRLSQPMPGTASFGTHSNLYTSGVVMRTTLTKTASAMHQIYLDSTGATSPQWADLSPFTRASNVSAADHLLTKIRILLEDDSITDVTSATCMAAYEKYVRTKDEKADFYRHLEHDRWMRFHALYNWTYNPQRDNSQRQHPSMVPFEKLDKDTQKKDDYSWQLLQQLADFLKD
ncbi:MAG: hypothetical protein E7492_08480 [Ruminococcaceae bacterium]|nr:hypothetical protein [Oscillospiraceae bacterium]